MHRRLRRGERSGLGSISGRSARVSVVAVCLILGHALLMAFSAATPAASAHETVAVAHAAAVEPGQPQPGDHPAGCGASHEVAPRQDGSGADGLPAAAVAFASPRTVDAAHSDLLLPVVRHLGPARALLQVWRI